MSRLGNAAQAFYACEIALFLGALVAFSDSGTASAQGDSTPKLTPEVLQAYGVTVKEDTGKKSCLIKITVEQSKFVVILPTLIETRMLGTGMDARVADTKIVTLEGVWAMTMAAYVVKQTYAERPSLNSCHFETHASFGDDYGVLQDQIMSSFDFRRSIYDKVNWDNMEARNLMNIAPNFKLSEWYNSQFEKELY